MKNYYFLKFTGILFLCILNGISVLAQGTGTIVGKVTDKKTGEALIGVSIRVDGSTKGVSTDINGAFRMNSFTPGKYTLVFTYLGYGEKKVTDIVVKQGSASNLDVQLESGGQSLNEVVVSARVNREAESALNLERKRSTVVIQKIGAQELERKGVSNIAEGLTKVTGIAVVNGGSSSGSGTKVVFVRGLGDRYNTATLNGLPIPSTDPDLKVIPLDLFPTSVVNNISVAKSFAPNYYGDFAGGAVDIITKDYPDRKFFKIGISSGYNSIATGKRFLQDQRKLRDFIGNSKGFRGVPAVVEGTKSYNSAQENYANIPFKTKFSPIQENAPLNTGISLSAGNHIYLKGEREIGFLVNAAFKNGYNYRPGVSALYQAQRTPIYNWDVDRYSYNANASGLLNFTYKWNKRNSVNVNSLFVNDANNSSSEFDGTEYDQGPVFSRLNEYVQNTLWINQIHGKHTVKDSNSVNWSLGYSKTTSDIPGRAQNTYLKTPTDNGFLYQYSYLSVSDNHRFFGALDDYELSGRVDYSVKSPGLKNRFNLGEITFGAQGRYKDRKFDSRQIDTRVNLGRYVDPYQADADLSVGNLGNPAESGNFTYLESYYPPNNYRADLSVGAAYTNLNFRFNKLQVVAGLRMEYSLQTIYYKENSFADDRDFERKDLEDLNPLPALTLKYLLNSKSNLLMAASKTVGRPQFIETAPFRNNRGYGVAQIEGTPNLDNSQNYNLDLKYEIYPSSSELISVGVFGKYIKDAIELAQINSADLLFKYVNSETAYVAGVELEINRNIGKFIGSGNKALRNMNLGLNASYLYSNVELNPERVRENNDVGFAPTNTSRPLYGASPYLINADISYFQKWSENANSQITVTYNVFGKRLYTAGNQGAPDIYEMPVNTLNLIINNKLTNRIGLDLTVGNILNPSAVIRQDFDDPLDISTQKYGVDAGVSLSYTF